MTTIVFAATIPENTPFVYRVSTSANPNPMISLAFVEANYKALESLLRERQRQIPRKNVEGSRPSEIEARENGNSGMNLPLLLAAHLGRNESGQPMQSSLTSVYGGHQPSTNIEGISLLTKAGSMLNYEDLKAKFRSHFSQQKKFTKTDLAVHNIKQRKGESTMAFAARYTDDTLQILGLHEDRHHGHDTNDCRQLRSQIKEAVKSRQLSYLVKGIKKERAKSSENQRVE
ncbi:hypothetical protein Tco_1100267 [Tanacetum coccineum]